MDVEAAEAEANEVQRTFYSLDMPKVLDRAQELMEEHQETLHCGFGEIRLSEGTRPSILMETLELLDESFGTVDNAGDIQRLINGYMSVDIAQTPLHSLRDPTLVTRVQVLIDKSWKSRVAVLMGESQRLFLYENEEVSHYQLV